MHKKHHKQHCNAVECLIKVLESLVESDCHCHDENEEGCITLNQGHHEITVNTDICPKKVFLSVRSAGVPVCVGSIDMVGYSLLPDGFLLYADINSELAEVCYIAIK